jgi:hypothetical protein
MDGGERAKWKGTGHYNCSNQDSWAQIEERWSKLEAWSSRDIQHALILDSIVYVVSV